MPIRFISLIGYRGAGKSAVARELANRLAWNAVDTDTEIEKRLGQSIAEIFATAGEPRFRDLEAAVIADVVGSEACVLATGGGAVLREVNRNTLKQAGPVVWLMASPDVLWRRMAADPASHQTRPNLTAGGGLAEVKRLLEVRAPLYRMTATLEMDTEKLGVAGIVERICGELSLDA